jgi:hypothetical protein
VRVPRRRREIRRERHRLISDDGRQAGRFEGLRLLTEEDEGEVPGETGLIEVTYQCAKHEARHHPDALGDGKSWLESPFVAESASVGKHASLDEAERMLTILATESRDAIRELDGVTTSPGDDRITHYIECGVAHRVPRSQHRHGCSPNGGRAG